MCITPDSYARVEDSILYNLTRKLSEYTAKFPREEVFIHTDREEYVSGEDLWFSIYLFDRKDLKLAGKGSNIVYVEVLDFANNPVVQCRTLIKDGSGPGHFILPDTLSSGYYTIRAYTNWMKNFLPVNCFMKEILVFNTLETAQPATIRHSLTSIFDKHKQNTGDTRIIVSYQADSIGIFLEAGKEQAGQGGNLYYLVAETRGNLNYAGKMKSDESGSHGFIARKDLIPGINHITVFDFAGRPVAEKLIFTPAYKRVKTMIQMDDSYGMRDRISPGIPDLPEGIFSISVSHGTAGKRPMNIEDYLVFGSEFNTINGSVLTGNLNDMTQAGADSTLSILESNWIKWPDIIQKNYPDIMYPLEKEFHFLSGIVVDGNRDTVLLCFPGKIPWFQYTITDEKGNFNFQLNIDEEKHHLVLMTEAQVKNVILESSFSDVYLIDNDQIESDSLETAGFSQIGINFQVEKIFRAVTHGDFAPVLYKTQIPVSFYGVPGDKVTLSEFIELPDMNEVFIELIPDVTLRQRKAGYEVLISDRINDRPFVLKPSLMIDGVLVRDASLIAGIQPDLVERIDIVKRKYLVGGYLFNGIVNVITKAADFSCIPFPDYMTRSIYRVAEPVPVFISPEYRTVAAIDSRLPDYRNTLYWNPSLSAGDTTVFWSSDNKMKWDMIIQGVTEAGYPFSISRSFIVR